MNQAIESGRAEFALKAVKDIQDNNVAKNYKSYAKKFPALVLSNGLAAAVVFVFEKSKGESNEKKAYRLIYNHISGWLTEKNFFNGNEKELHEYVCSLNSDTYRVVTNEILALFEWFKRFASGLIEGEADSN